MSIIAADIRRISNEATALREIEERQKKMREHQEKESTRLAALSRAKELFEPVLEDIKNAAAKGYTSHRHSYNGDYEESRWQAEAIASEAKERGFKVQVKSERANMGDSAAPGWTTFHWLEIGW